LTSTVTVAPVVDLARMQRERRARLNDAMAAVGVDALVLLGNSNVSYATGASWPLGDPGHSIAERPVAVVLADDDLPHLFTPFAEEARSEPGLPEDHLHDPVYLEFDESAGAFVNVLTDLGGSGRRWAIDELPGALRRSVPPALAEGMKSADDVVGNAKLVKTQDELGLLRIALRITEEAIAPVQASLKPGICQSELTAEFFRAAFELGAKANILDPIWQVMPWRIVDGPWTTHGDIACPLLTTERRLAEGDVLWVDTGISYGGFASDFGRTWIVGGEPTQRQRAQYTAWREILEAVLSEVRAGATGSDLTRAALKVPGERQPWMKHFYLAHGLGIESAESPFIGTDLGEAYDDRQVLYAGTVIVLEPLVWEDGYAGYRAEEVIVVTEDGWLSLTDYPYDPYEN
jgi:Xaa-Pro dipeptidase